MMLRAVAAAAFAAALSFAPALAREFTDAEKQALGERVATFDAAMTAGDGEGIISVVPPPILDAIATQAGIDADTLRTEMIKQTTQIMQQITFEKFEMDVAATQYLETPDGTPYALIPTETLINLGEQGRMRSVTNTLGLFDGAEAYLIRTEDTATINFLRQVYPSFAEVAFIVGTTEMLQE